MLSGGQISMIVVTEYCRCFREDAVPFWLYRVDDKDRGGRAAGPPPTMEHLRHVVQGWLEIALTPIAAGLLRLGASANQVSVGGFALNVVSAGLVAADHLVAAGVLYLIAGTLDLLDGMLARLAGTPTRFGAFLDSTIDRASEGVVFAAIGYRFAVDGAAIDAGVVVLALLGSFLVSYTRARAEGLGAECKVGIATRAERVVLVTVGLVAGLLTQAIYLVALLSAITVVQRVLRVRQELRTSR